MRNMSQENASPPRVACNMVENVDYKACMAVARTLLQLGSKIVVVGQPKVFSTQLQQFDAFACK